MSVGNVTTSTKQKGTPPQAAQATPSASKATSIARRALQPIENSPTKPSSSKRSAQHLGDHQELQSVEKTARVQEAVLPAAPLQILNNVRPTITLSNGSTYTGPWLGNQMHGLGILTYQNGDTYEGPFVHNKLQGDGTYTFKNGEKIVASFVDNNPHGHGTHMFPNGLQYTGPFIKGQKQSEGVWNSPRFLGPIKQGDTVDGQSVHFLIHRSTSGHICYGQFNDSNKMHGFGLVFHPEKEHFVGSFRNGLLEGLGVLTKPKGNSYIGSLLHQKFEGYGALTREDGSKYIGLFRNGLKHGHGTYLNKNGATYIGQFVDDKPNGHGILCGIGVFLEGQFKDSKFLPFETVKLENGEYVGQIVDGKFHGYGTIYYADGTEYKGQFVHGNKQGNGTWTYKDGTISEGLYQDGKFLPFETVKLENGKYVGQIVDGKFHGYGTIYYADGSEYRGQFVHGNKQGKGTWKHVNGTLSEGRYQDDEFLTFRITQPSPQSIYEGECTTKGKAHGEGTYNSNNGETYVGSFKYGKAEGYGVSVDRHKTHNNYKGSWKNGLPHGSGFFASPSGECLYPVHYKNGIRDYQSNAETLDALADMASRPH